MVTLVGSPHAPRGYFTFFAALASVLFISLFASEYALALSNQSADVGGNAAAETNLTVTGSSTNVDTNFQRCTGDGPCSQKSKAETNANTGMGVTVDNQSTNDVEVRQRCSGRRARLGLCNQEAEATGNTLSDVSGGIAGSATNVQDSEQQCTGDGPCNQAAKKDETANTTVNAGVTSRATLRKLIRQNRGL